MQVLGGRVGQRSAYGIGVGTIDEAGDREALILREEETLVAIHMLPKIGGHGPGLDGEDGKMPLGLGKHEVGLGRRRIPRLDQVGDILEDADLVPFVLASDMLCGRPQLGQVATLRLAGMQVQFPTEPPVGLRATAL